MGNLVRSVFELRQMTMEVWCDDKLRKCDGKTEEDHEK